MKSAQLILPWGDFRWHRPQIFLSITITLISICTSIAAILYSGLWFFVVEPSAPRPESFGLAAPWLFAIGSALVALFIGHRIVSWSRKPASLFLLLGPLRLFLAVLLWPGVIGRVEHEETLLYSFGALLLEGFVFAFLVAPHAATKEELSAASLEEKILQLPPSFSLSGLFNALSWRFVFMLSLKRDGLYARQDRMLRRSAFWLVVAGSLNVSLCGAAWSAIPGLVAILLGFFLRVSLILRDRARLSWLKRVVAGEVSRAKLSPIQPQSELPLFYLGEGLSYDTEVSLVMKEDGAYRDQDSRLARVPSQLALAERFMWLRARGIIAFVLPLLLLSSGLSYRTSHRLEHFYDDNPRPVLFDINQDAAPDLLWLVGSQSGLAISFNDGSGRFSYPAFVPGDIFGKTRRLTLLDVDGDSTQELVSLGSTSYTISSYLGAISLSPVPLPRGLLGEGAVMSPLRDLDGDQDLDLVECIGRRVVLITNNGDEPPSITSEVSLRELSQQSQGYVECEDLIWLKDSASTLLVVGSSGLSLAPSAIFSVKVTGSELFDLQELSAVTNKLEKPLAGDVNGDGHLDLLGANPARFGRFGLDPSDPKGFGCYLYTGDGSGSFTLSARDACPDGYYFDGLVLGDIDADTDLDFVAVSHLLQVHSNNGAGFFERLRHSAMGL